MDTFHANLEYPTFELFRLLWCGAFVGSLLWLFRYRANHALAVACSLTLFGVLLWAFHHGIATTITFPVGFGIAAFVHGRQFWNHRGFASGVLSSLSAGMALFCSIFYTALQTGDRNVMFLGFLHFALLNVLAVLLGWINLPREIRGQTSVFIHRKHGLALFCAVILSEIGIILGMLVFFSWPPVLYLLSKVFLLASVLVLFFYYRHRLVMFTDNVSKLLDERTADLQRAQEELSHQNLTQAKLLQKQAEELDLKSQVIKRQSRLELATQTIGEAAHDIQNLISPIMIQTSKIIKSTDASQNIRKAANAIQDQVESLLMLNQQMLGLSPKNRIKLQLINLTDVVQQLVDSLPQEKVLATLEPGCWINGSLSQLNRIVINLLNNAMDVLPPQEGRVIIHLQKREFSASRRCHLGFLKPGTYIALSVQDNGPGIPKKNLEKIFEPFFSTKEGYKRSGLGLGLSIVATLVDDHSGILDLQTGPEGSTFSIFFPPALPAKTESLCGNETVLVITNDTSPVIECRAAFEDSGYLFLTGANESHAMETLQSLEVDLLVLDLPPEPCKKILLGAIHLRPGARSLINSRHFSASEKRDLRQLGAEFFEESSLTAQEMLSKAREILDARLQQLST